LIVLSLNVVVRSMVNYNMVQYGTVKLIMYNIYFCEMVFTGFTFFHMILHGRLIVGNLRLLFAD
jgi:hypothetical protein